MLDTRTLGGSTAAIVLQRLINEHPESKVISRKVSRLVQNYNRYATEIEKSGMDNRTKLVVYTLLTNDYKAIAFDILKDGVCTYTQNVISSRWHRWMDRENIIYTLRRNKKNEKLTAEK